MTAPADYTSAFYPNSQTGPASRRMLLGFDGWLTQQPGEVQSSLATHLRSFDDPAAVAVEKDRLAAIEFVHERTKAPRRQIADNWHTFRGGLAERLAEMPSGATNYEWEAVKDDDAAFVAMARKRVQFEQDRETMMDSIRSQAANAALSVDTGLADKRRLQVFAGFDGSEVPGYDPDDLPAIKAAYNETVQRVRINTHRERAVAREVADYLIAESGGEIAKIAADAADPAALSQAVQKILAIPKDRRPLAIEFVRQHLSEGGNEDVGYGLRGKKPKPVESTAGGGMRALGRGAADVWNKLKSASQRLSESTGLVDDASEFRDVQEQLRSLVNGTLDPLTPGGAIDTMVMGSAQSLPAMAMIAAGPVGRALSVTYYQQGSYEKFKADPAMAGVSDAAVSSMALLSGTAQAALDSVQLGILTKMAGGSALAKSLQGIANPTAALGASGAYVAGQVGRFGAGLALETGIEVLQNQYADAAVQQLGAILGTGAPPDWAKVNAAAMAEFPELALTMIPLVAFGTTAGGIRDARSAAALARSPELLRAAGFGPSQALAISSAENPVGALRRLWNERNPMQGAPAGATPADVARQAWTDANAAAQSAVAAAQDARDTPGVAYVQRTDAGWQMVDTEGANWQVAATESVPQLLVEAGKAATLREGQAMQQIADAIAQREPGVKQQLTGEQVTVTKTPGGVEVDSALKLIPFDAATLANFNAQLALLGGGNSAVVNGANWIAQDGTQMILANKSAEGVMTQAHEFVEARFRRFIDADIEFGNLAIRAAAIVAPLFDPAKTRTEERAFAERVQRVASGRTTETEARETMVELVVADVLGRRKDGSVMPTGSISAGITEAIAAATNPAERAALGKFRAFLRAVRSYLLGLFSTAAKLKKGRREGIIKEGDDFSVFAEKLLGLDAEKEHVAAVTAAVNAGATGSLSGVGSGMSNDPGAARQQDSNAPGGFTGEQLTNLLRNIARFGWNPAEFGLSQDQVNAQAKADEQSRNRISSEESAALYFPPADSAPAKWGSVPESEKFDPRQPADDGYFYHITTPGSAKKIVEAQKLVPGKKQAMSDGYYADYSKGKVFLSDRKGVGFWKGRISDHLEAAGRSGKVSVIRIPKWAVSSNLKPDEVGSEDAKSPAWFSESAVAPNEAATAPSSGATASLGSVNTLEALAVQLENKIAAGGPKERLSTYTAIAEELRGMARAIAFNDSGSDPAGDLAAVQSAEIRALDDNHGDAVEEMRIRHEFDFGAAKAEKWSADRIDALRQRQRIAEQKLKLDHKAQIALTRQRHSGEMDALKAKTDKQAMKRALTTLDALLAKVPSEVRGRVGGFTALAQLTTPEARAAFLKERIEKLDKVFETWLRKEYLSRIREIFRQSKPKGGSGEKAEGKIGAFGHAWMDYAKEAGGMTAKEAEGKIAAIEAVLARDITADEIAELGRAWGPDTVTDEVSARMVMEEQVTILETFGGMDDMSAADMERAYRSAEDAYEAGRYTWLQVVLERKERRAFRRALAVDNAGGPYDPQKHNRARPFDPAVGLLDMHLSFEQIVGENFGPESATHQWVRSAARKSQDSETDMLDTRRREFAEFVRSKFGGPVKSRVRLMAMQERRDTGIAGPAGHLSQLQAVHMVMLARDESSREWITSHGWTDDVMTEVEAWLTDDAKAVRDFLTQRYFEQYDRINRVHVKLKGISLPRVVNYAPRLVEHGGRQQDMAIGDQNAAGMVTGFLRRRFDRPQGPPKLTDALAAYWANQTTVSHWLAWAETMGDFRATIGSRDARLAAETHHGAKAKKLMRELLAIEEGGVREAIAASEVGGLLRRFFDARSKTALFGKLSVLAKQLPAAFGSAAKVSAGQWMASASRVLSGRAAIGLAEMFNSDVIQRRLANDSEIASIAAKGNLNTPGLAFTPTAAAVVDFAMGKAGGSIGLVDATFTTFSAAVAYDAVYREMKAAGMDDAAAKAEAWERTAVVVGQTAQPQTIIDKSIMEVEWPTMGRLIFAFQGAARQAWSLMYQAVKHFKKDPAQHAQTLALFTLVVPTLTYLPSGLVRYATSDDDLEDEFSLKDWGYQLAAAPAQGTIIVGPIWEAWLKTNPRAAETPIASDLTAALASFRKLIESDEERKKRPKDQRDFDSKDIGKIVEGLSTAIGGRAAAIGVANNVMQQIIGAAAAVTPGDQRRESYPAKQTRKDREKQQKPAR